MTHFLTLYPSYINVLLQRTFYFKGNLINKFLACHSVSVLSSYCRYFHWRQDGRLSLNVSILNTERFNLQIIIYNNSSLSFQDVLITLLSNSRLHHSVHHIPMQVDWYLVSYQLSSQKSFAYPLVHQPSFDIEIFKDRDFQRSRFSKNYTTSSKLPFR